MKEVITELRKFRDDRNWKQFHTPENLSKSIVIEAAELLENFQWGSISSNVKNIKEELADIMTYCLLMCDYYGFEAKDIIIEKLKLNEQKYPIEKSYGKSDKYTKF